MGIRGLGLGIREKAGRAEGGGKTGGQVVGWSGSQGEAGREGAMGLRWLQGRGNICLSGIRRHGLRLAGGLVMREFGGRAERGRLRPFVQLAVGLRWFSGRAERTCGPGGKDQRWAAEEKVPPTWRRGANFVAEE